MSGGFWLGGQPLLLASGSATRRQLLEAAGLPVTVERPKVDERALSDPMEKHGASPSAIARTLASAKAADVSRRMSDRLTLGADQVLDCDGECLHKPASLQAAHRQLARLSGRSHRLTAAMALAREGRVIWQVHRTATLKMRPLGDDSIARYLAFVGDQALTSVGAYQLEGAGIQLFSRISGDHSTILGLPMLPLLHKLRQMRCLAE